MLKDILIQISNTNINITSANVKATGKKIGTIILTLEVDGVMTLRKVIQNIQAIPEVYSVKRIPATNQPNKQPTQHKKKKETK